MASHKRAKKLEDAFTRSLASFHAKMDVLERGLAEGRRLEDRIRNLRKKKPQVADVAGDPCTGRRDEEE